MARLEIDQEEEKGDMTPMIDIVFLLLIFFLLTTKFIVPEKMISNLLPTNKGQASASPPVVEPPQDLNILIYPEGFQRGMGVEQMDTLWHSQENTRTAVFRVSNNPHIIVKSGDLSGSTRKADLDNGIGPIHSYIWQFMEAAETAGSRKEQRPVVIHCFSGTSWKYALIAYDAVRAYEKQKAGGLKVVNSETLREAREVSFAPPRIRNYHTWELGNELWEIVNMK